MINGSNRLLYGCTLSCLIVASVLHWEPASSHTAVTTKSHVNLRRAVMIKFDVFAYAFQLFNNELHISTRVFFLLT